MDPSVELSTAKAVISSGKFEDLIGTHEAHDLEYKAELWNLQSTEDQFEFAKDIAAMANTTLGLIVIGMSTQTLKTSQDDVVNGFKLLDIADPRGRKLRQIVNDFIYPQLAVSITASPYHRDPSLGLLTLEILEDNESSRPFVVIKTPCGKDAKDGNRGLSDKYLSYPVRNASCTTGYPHRDLVDWAHSWKLHDRGSAAVGGLMPVVREVNNAE